MKKFMEKNSDSTGIPVGVIFSYFSNNEDDIQS